MPRMARVVMPKYPHSVVQRGHNRQVVFAEPADFEYHLETLAESKAEYAVHLCGFCLMTNHVRFVLQPGERVVGLCQLMKGLPHQQQGRPRMASENKSVPFFFIFFEQSPDPRSVALPEQGEVIAFPHIGGLHQEHGRAAQGTLGVA